MDTEVLKRTIGAKCLVLDPRSKCCEFKLAKVISANYSVVNTFQNDNNNNICLRKPKCYQSNGLEWMVCLMMTLPC